MKLSEHLFRRLADNDNPSSLASRLRERRFLHFAKILPRQPEPVRILDVGGTPQVWSRHIRALGRTVEVTLLNCEPVPPPVAPALNYAVGDARRMSQFRDGEFDVCFSNSVIEHFPTFADQRLFADEIRRVARAYYVQTPNRRFPIEPHFLAPGWQFMPASTRAWLLQRRDWGWMRKANGRAEALQAVRSIRLLTAGELGSLFPEAEIRRESIAGMTKSLIAVRPAPPTSQRQAELIEETTG